MRIGILGGSFDPIHNGHLIIAECAREQLQLDQVRLVVSARQPLKDGHGAAAIDRLRMVELAVTGLAATFADGREVVREGPSYTADTLMELHDEQPAAELVLILGSDAAVLLPGWHRPELVRSTASLAVFHRFGTPQPEHTDFVVPAMELSSTAIRDRARAGKSLRGWVPTAVADYIAGLYLYRREGGEE